MEDKLSSNLGKHVKIEERGSKSYWILCDVQFLNLKNLTPPQFVIFNFILCEGCIFATVYHYIVISSFVFVKKTIYICIFYIYNRDCQESNEKHLDTRYEERAQTFSAITTQGGTVTPRLRKRWNRKIRDSNLEDYNEWLRKMTEEMEETHKKGDSETKFRIVKLISDMMVVAN